MSEISRGVIPFEKSGIRCHLHGEKGYPWDNQLFSRFCCRKRIEEFKARQGSPPSTCQGHPSRRVNFLLCEQFFS